jgi:hypothetical protein
MLAAALTAWGPVAPSPELETPREYAAPAATASEAESAPTEAVRTPAAPPPAIPASIVAKAPVAVRAAPAFAPAPPPTRERGVPLHKRWWFWTIAGGLFTGTIVATYAMTRPGPQPYTGNAPPYYVPFP